MDAFVVNSQKDNPNGFMGPVREKQCGTRGHFGKSFFRAPNVNFHPRRCSAPFRPSLRDWFVCCIGCYHKAALIGLERERGLKIRLTEADA